MIRRGEVLGIAFLALGGMLMFVSRSNRVVGLAFIEADVAPMVLFKRTHASMNALVDGNFVVEHLGLNATVHAMYECAAESDGYYEDGGPCAARVTVGDSSQFQMHYYESFITPMGNTSVGEWVDSWVGSLENWGEDEWEWPEFAPQAVTFYVEHLAPFEKNWADHGITPLRRFYVDADGIIVFSARIVVPYSGHVIEIVSSATHDESLHVAYRANECPTANKLRLTMANMKARYDDTSSSSSTGGAFPGLFAVQVSQPVASMDEIDALPDFLRLYGYADIPTADVVAEAEECAFSTTTFSGVTPNNGVDLRIIYNKRARVAPGDCHLKFYGQYMTSILNYWLGSNEGFSRYADWHIGLQLMDSLDSNAARLQDGAVGFHNGAASPYEGSALAGSNWCAGTSGVAVEFRGWFSFDFFETRSVVPFDYCSPSGFTGKSVAASSAANYCPHNYDKYCITDCGASRREGRKKERVSSSS